MKLQNIIRNSVASPGKATIKGTDVTVEFVLEQLASGASVEDIRKQHPSLTEGLVLEAIAFAADELKKQGEDAERTAWTQSFIQEYRPALEALAKQ
ncbi:MAG TPA: DUF433 domain-containing protein [Patescibacteria group bacterium]|uniref:DUF433 domain-containing protein n=1 Tax=Candidatus Uhrbacteria bacterium GW2011_GWA2_52_8d TaxID=1618979 RepID=A0A0G2AKM1_9BACT|nr:MAG: hypothetical protein UY76_C0008G0017 [Candidatus Uhrbacteria bacterium GW2011_GWA2_52_8d]HLD21176.1 DUF433 domain-containing protein [Patescibacteria group bacterium]